MKKKFSILLFVTLLLNCRLTSFGQLSGTVTVPGTFSTIGSVILSINQFGISGPLLVNVAAGHTETASVGGYSLNSVVGSSTLNTLIFQKSGVGINPLIVAPAGGTATPGSARQDGVWRFIACDNITIDGIDITDPNTSNPATMEYGYGFFKEDQYDGCHNNTIKNCTISLKRINNAVSTLTTFPPGSRGIEFANSAYNTHTINILVESPQGSNSNNRFYSNTIQNCNIGIAINGCTVVSRVNNFDTNNDVGGTTAVTGNTIINFGGGGTVAATGIRLRGQKEINISNNYINSNNGSGVNHLGPLWLIHNDLGTSGAVTILNNTLTVKSGSTCIDAFAIETDGSSAASNSTINISNNVIANATSTTAFSGVDFTGILNTAAPAHLLMTGNTFTNNTIDMSGSGLFSLINNTGSVSSVVNISNNVFSSSISGTFNGTVNVVNTAAGTNSTAVSINNNTFLQMALTGTASVNFITSGGACSSLQMNNNTWNNLSINGSGAFTLLKNTANVNQSLSVANNSIITGFTRTAASGSFNCYYGVNSSAATSNMSFTSNNFSNITSTVSGTGSFFGMLFDEGEATPHPNKQIYNNVISNINYNASGAFTGFALKKMGSGSLALPSTMHDNTVTAISSKGSVFGMTFDNIVMQLHYPEIYKNQFTNFSNTTTGVVYGASLSSYDSQFKFYKNKIANLNCIGSKAIGIDCQGTSTVTMYNNIIGHLAAPTAGYPEAVIGISVLYAKSVKLYNNTVYLTGTAFGATCIYFESYGSTINATLKNNILMNLCSASGTGSISAIYMDAATVYNAASNNNVFYAGTPGSANTLLRVGTAAYNTLATAQIPMIGAESNSGIENVAFASTTWSATNYLAVNSTSITLVESGAVSLPEVSDDFNGSIRNIPFPDIGAIEGIYAPTSVDLSSPVVVNSGFSTDPCNTTTRTYTALISDATGVASGSLSPTLYYKLGIGSYSTTVGTLSSGNATLGVWSFNLSYSAAYYTKISYYLALQDIGAPARLCTFPVALFPGTSVNNITNAPSPLSYTVYPSLGGTYTVGASGTYTSLTEAAKAYNNACLTGPVTFVLSDALYSSNETFPITFKKNELASATNSLLIIPANNTAAVITSTNNSDTALVKFLDAAYITLDGLNNAGSSITIINSSTSKPSMDILIGSSEHPGGGCNHIQLQNLLITGAVTNTLSFGILGGTGTQNSVYSILGGLNHNFITIHQNTFTAVQHGLYAFSKNTNTLNGIYHHWKISNNQFGPVSSSTANLATGLSFTHGRALTITSNTVSNISPSSQSGVVYGMAIGGMDSIFVDYNSITSVKGGSNNASTGMYFTGNDNAFLRNNMITDIGFTSIGNITEPIGLSMSGTGIKMYNNTIALTQGSTVVNFSWYLTSKGLYIASGTRNLDMRNNIIYNNVNNQFSSASFSELLDVPDGAASFSQQSNNILFTSGIGSTYGYNAGPSSATIEPEFVSASNGHLNPASLKNYYLQNMGTPVPGVVIDIDNQTRSASAPDAGADEFTSTATCTNAVAGSIDWPASYTVCSSLPFAIKSNSVSGGIDIVNQWLISSSSAGTYTNALTGAGYTTPNYSLSGLPDGVYYLKLSTSCPAYSLSTTSNIATVTVVSPPTLSLSIPQNTFCSNTVVTITASGANDYKWSNGNTSATLTVFQNASASYYLKYSNAPCPADTVFNITLYAQPSPTISVVSPTAYICAGSQTTLSASGANTYSWSNGASGATITLTPTASAAYSVTGSYLNGCSKTATTLVLTNASPTIMVSTSPTLCGGQSATLSANGAVSYTWSTGTVASSIVVTPSVTTVYTVTGRNSSLCTATNAVSANVVPAFTISASGPLSICSGQTANLTASGATNYTWSTGAFTNSVTVSPTLNTTYTVTGESGGCSVTAIKTLSVNANPTVYITGSTVACLGQTGTLVANGASSYTWNTGSTANTITISPTATTIFSLTGNVGNCQGQASISINTATLPLISITAPAAFVCPSSPVTFTASGANTYTWSNSATGNSATFNPGTASIYTVSGTNTSGCVNSETVSILTYSVPVITVNPPSATVCALSPASFTASGASTYTWNGTATGNSVTLTPTSSLFYQLTGASAQGCTNTVFFGVTTNPLPTLSISPSSAAVCIGSTASFTASGAASYTWNGSIVSSAVSFLPFSNTTYTVSGTNAFNCIANATVAVITNSLPIVSISPSATTICAFSTTTLTASGANSYAWSNALSGPSIIVSAATSTVFTVVGTNTTGCVSSPANATVNILPLPSLSISASTYTVCQGSPSTLTALGALSYTWNVGSLVTNTPIVIVTPTTSSVYQVIGTGANGCSNSFSNAVTASIVMIPTPTLSISGNTVICSGKSATLTTLAPTAVSYSWNSGSSSQSISVSPVSTTNYTSMITDASGCYNSATVSVLVNPLPTVSISGSTVACNGTPVTLTANGAVSYLWNTSGTQNTVTVSPVSATAYSVIGTDVNGCESAANHTVSIANSPTISIIASNTTVCSGNTLILQGSGATTYTWSGGITDNVAFIPSGSATYSVSGTGTNGCQSVANISILVNTLPVLSISGNSLVCPGSAITLYASGAQTYTWSTNQTGSSSTVVTAPNHTYSVTGTGTNNCLGSAGITLTPFPAPNIQVSSSQPYLCLGDSAELTVSGGIKYLWNNNDTLQTIAVKPTVTTFYTVSGIDANGCSDTTTYEQTVGDCTGLTAQSRNAAIRIYPNPNHGQFKVETSSPGEHRYLEIYNVLGQLIATFKLEGFLTTYDLKENAKGIYTLRIVENGNSLQHLKMIKE